MTSISHVDGRRRPGVFALVVGIACGLLLAALSIPGRVSRSPSVEGAAGEERRSEVSDRSDQVPSIFGEGGPADQTTGGTRPAGTAGPTADDAGAADGDGGGVGADAGASVATGRGDEVTAAGEARGVTDNKIRIGVAIPDIGAFAVVDEFNLGDMRGHMESILDTWRREGLVPVHGRDVEFVYREFNIVGDEDVAACNGFVKDDRVFMVIGIRSFEGGAECLADRFDTPVVTLEFPRKSDQAFASMQPWMFTLRATPERIARNWIHWAQARGIFDGRTIGIYKGPETEPWVDAVKKTLAQFGHKVAVETSTSSRTGGPEDQVAVQRFRAADVDLALLLVSALPATSFMEQAESQGYRPTYIATDFGDHSSDAASSTFPPAQYGGTLAMTMTRAGEIQAGRGLSPKGEACVSNYERHSGRQLGRSSPESAELVVLLQECDETGIVIEALHRAGSSLDRFSFVGAADTIANMDGASHGSLTYRADKHHGADSQRTTKWLASCECWTVVTEFAPLWSP